MPHGFNCGVFRLRGVGGSLIICEEASFIDPAVFYEVRSLGFRSMDFPLTVPVQVVIPLLEVSGTSLICISTPLSENNHYSELCASRDANGKEVFRVIRSL